MEPVGHGTPRICYIGTGGDMADWVQTGFERADGDVEFVVETDREAAIERIETAQTRRDPWMQSALVETEAPFDCIVCMPTETMDIVDVIETIRENHDHLPIVLFVEDGSETLASRAITAGITEYVMADGEDSTGVLAERVLDIVDEFRTERRQALHRERTRRIAAENADIITVISPGTSVTYQNPTITEVLGYEPDEMEDVVPFERVHPDDWQMLREEFYDAIRDSSYVPQVEYRVKNVDDEWRTVESRARNLLDDPLINGFVITTRDVTERKERERELTEYRTLVENIREPMYILDSDGHFEMVNDAFLEHTGYEREFVEGEHVSMFLREEDIQTGINLIRELLTSDRDWDRFEFVVEAADGDIHRYEDTITVLEDDDGRFCGSVGIIRRIDDD